MKRIYKKRCQKCAGIGLVELKNIRRCMHCKNEGNNVCYLCENKGGSVRFDECSMCTGYGELFYDVETNKRVDLYAISNYSIISQ